MATGVNAVPEPAVKVPIAGAPSLFPPAVEHVADATTVPFSRSVAVVDARDVLNIVPL